ncbi:helix-turn-helix domain-containing protein [Patescibacteria group bacterium]|nr:helix-turn-helix domain-containing protein [Patescibacteria group bacterium]MBU1499534.1 helix-turn-helix domain-containing protein [Patescibacteria group bacterium]
MKQKFIDFRQDLDRRLKDPVFRKAYEKIQPEFAVIRAILDARIKKRLTQKKLAAKLKTKQSVISRLETGRGNPTVRFLQKLAAAFDTTLEINFRPLSN